MKQNCIEKWICGKNDEVIVSREDVCCCVKGNGDANNQKQCKLSPPAYRYYLSLWAVFCFGLLFTLSRAFLVFTKSFECSGPCIGVDLSFSIAEFSLAFFYSLALCLKLCIPFILGMLLLFLCAIDLPLTVWICQCQYQYTGLVLDALMMLTIFIFILLLTIKDK
jgi:hypothetical protein